MLARSRISVAWIVLIAIASIMFLLARASRWAEGVTWDDSVSLLLGTLPFAAFYMFGSLFEQREVVYGFFARVWIISLGALLIVRLTPTVFLIEENVLPVVGSVEKLRFLTALSCNLFGATVGLLVYACQEKASARAVVWALVACLSGTAFMWLFIFQLPPDFRS